MAHEIRFDVAPMSRYTSYADRMIVSIGIVVDGAANRPPSRDEVRALADRMYKTIAEGWEKSIFQDFHRQHYSPVNAMKAIIEGGDTPCPST